MTAHPSESVFADRSAAEIAVDLVLPMIQAGLESKRIGESGILHIVVMNPAARPQDCSFEAAILHEYSVGDRNAWDADYALYAREKARICWQYQRNGHEVRACSPHLLSTNHTGVWGGIWLDGISVGVSGADPWYDEAIAYAVAAAIRAVAKQRALQQPEQLWIAETTSQ
ncbi:MAG TPA: hypothetical protein VKZ70_14105 [Burkholderiaceae bacterium]|nr:hypothetical protein [Burkholderiaceae bacterium]